MGSKRLPAGRAMYSVHKKRPAVPLQAFHVALISGSGLSLWKLITSDWSSMNRLIGESRSGLVRSPAHAPAVSG